MVMVRYLSLPDSLMQCLNFLDVTKNIILFMYETRMNLFVTIGDFHYDKLMMIR